MTTRGRDFLVIVGALVLLLALVSVTVGVTPWGLIAEAWRTVFGTNTPVR